jgi:predicted Zn-dependent peptidase
LNAAPISRAKSGVIGHRQVQMQDNSDLGMMVGLDELTGVGYDFFKTADAKYEAVTLNDIKRVAGR